MPYDPVKVVYKCLGKLDYWQVLGDIGDVWLVSIFLFPERFPLHLKFLYHHVPRYVGSGDALSGRLIVSYYVTRGVESLLGFCSCRRGVVLESLNHVLHLAWGPISCLTGV